MPSNIGKEKAVYYDTAQEGPEQGLSTSPRITQPLAQPIVIYFDNISAIAITKNDEYHPRSKHIDICYHFIPCVVQENLIHINYVLTDDMAADMLMSLSLGIRPST